MVQAPFPVETLPVSRFYVFVYILLFLLFPPFYILKHISSIWYLAFVLKLMLLLLLLFQGQLYHMVWVTNNNDDDQICVKLMCVCMIFCMRIVWMGYVRHRVLILYIKSWTKKHEICESFTRCVIRASWKLQKTTRFSSFGYQSPLSDTFRSIRFIPSSRIYITTITILYSPQLQVAQSSLNSHHTCK